MDFANGFGNSKDAYIVSLGIWREEEETRAFGVITQGCSDQHLPIVKDYLNHSTRRPLSFKELFPFFILGVPFKIPHKKDGF